MSQSALGSKGLAFWATACSLPAPKQLGRNASTCHLRRGWGLPPTPKSCSSSSWECNVATSRPGPTAQPWEKKAACLPDFLPALLGLPGPAGWLVAAAKRAGAQEAKEKPVFPRGARPQVSGCGGGGAKRAAGCRVRPPLLGRSCLPRAMASELAGRGRASRRDPCAAYLGGRGCKSDSDRHRPGAEELRLEGETLLAARGSDAGSGGGGGTRREARSCKTA